MRAVREDFCLAAIDQNFQVPMEILQRMLEEGYARIAFSYSLTEKGETRMKELNMDHSQGRAVIVMTEEALQEIDSLVLAELKRRNQS